MLKVFCRLNLLVVMESADCDKLMLRFLKNSKPPVEVGSLKRKYAVHNFMLTHCDGSRLLQVVYLRSRGWRRSFHLPGTDGFKESDHVPTEVPLALLQRRVEQESSVLSAHCWNLHVLQRQG